MSVAVFSKLLVKCEFSTTSQKWFPTWVERYARFSKQSRSSPLVVDHELLIEFLRTLRESGVPAWQRLQTARAVECYRDVVLSAATPNLSDVILKLTDIAERERQTAVGVVTSGGGRADRSERAGGGPESAAGMPAAGCNGLVKRIP